MSGTLLTSEHNRRILIIQYLLVIEKMEADMKETVSPAVPEPVEIGRHTHLYHPWPVFAMTFLMYELVNSLRLDMIAQRDLFIILTCVFPAVGFAAGLVMGVTARFHDKRAAKKADAVVFRGGMSETDYPTAAARDWSVNRNACLWALPAAVTALTALLFPGLESALSLLQMCVAFLTPSFLVWQLAAGADGIGIAFVAPLVYRVGILLGEAAFKALDSRRVWRAVGCLALCALVAGGVWSFTRWDQVRKNQLPVGYGFDYVKGLSSTDLDRYNPANPDNILPKVESSYRLTDPDAFPRLDGAEAAYPVYAAFANACYDDLAQVLEQAEYDHWISRGDSRFRYAPPVDFSNTILAFDDLLDGECDIFFGAMPSAGQYAEAAEKGVELVLTPIGREAFVFIVSSDNPVTGLTGQQVRDIYSGRTRSWNLLGGHGEIVAFQRPKGSGSQTLLEHIMGDTPIMTPVTEKTTSGMLGLIDRVAEYRNGAGSIGYTFRYFLQGMHPENAAQVRMLSIDGAAPDIPHIQDGSYPYTTYLYAITVKGSDRVPQAFLDWMQGPEGQAIVEQIGYVPLV